MNSHMGIKVSYKVNEFSSKTLKLYIKNLKKVDSQRLKYLYIYLFIYLNFNRNYYIA